MQDSVFEKRNLAFSFYKVIDCDMLSTSLYINNKELYPIGIGVIINFKTKIMKKFKNNKAIEVLGASFKGVHDMIDHAIKKTPKDEVYVGEDSQRYPCFDSDDYAYEDRYYTNLVFAKSQEELEKRLKVLKRMNQLDYNYNKLTEKLHPMAYWEGDTYHDVYLTEGSHK